jgi:serine/threonine protein kinase
MSMLLLNFLFVLLNLPVVLAAGVDQFVYSGFAGANITIDGVATITPDGLLDLTNAHQRLKGHAFYPAPLRFLDSTNGTVKPFAVSFVLAIHPNYRSSQGMAFFIAKNMDFSSALPFQYFGVFNSQNQGNSSNHIFAVEFDTVLNMELRDVDANHVGIDINSAISIQSHTAGFYNDKTGSFNNLNLTGGEGLQVWIDYGGETARINVTMSPLGMAKPARPLLSAIYDLSTVFTEEAYLGFGSAAGMDGSGHYILGLSFGMDRPAPAIDISRLPKLPRVGPKPRSKVPEIVLPLATASFVLAVGITIFLLVRRHRRYAELREDWEVEFGPHRFSYKDLYYATQGFKSNNLLGVGGFGTVYKGVLPKSKLEIAVKRVSHDSKQGMKEFIAEVVSIGRLQHNNLVQLLGYCRRKGQLFLVYECMPNGSLDKYLYHRDNTGLPTLNWAQRFRFIRGVASGLLYLHEEWEKVVIHRDVKASNVLLDREMNARLGDFGLSRLYDHGTDPQSTHVAGTVGYLAPELACTGKVTPLIDVFAFGIFILEIVCGQRPIEQDTREEQPMLVDRVLEHWHNESLSEIVDSKLPGDYDVNQVYLALKVGLLCSHPFMDARPTMRQVIQYLDCARTSPELTPIQTTFEMLAVMQREGFDPYIMSCPSSMTASILSGGR